ncbi:uncharacterized protein C1orf131 homolog [Myxocyprinus asiaticus]|uniref:uncharacterized protein C1orf131 homolog n=1 Tax=Myxocyprinus asiaticus TaxID=70543 RepID=UPI002221843F|nr:uncharacterized protein C1orf131 homolog [Myxocyprinus asiaticus]
MSVTRDAKGGESDEDRIFLDQVLNTLYDFGDGAKNRRLKKSRKRKKTKEDNTDIEKDTEENAHTVSYETDSDQHMTNVSNSSVCENTVSGTRQSSVEVVTFIDPLKKKKLSQPVEARRKAPDIKEKKKKELNEELTIEKARFEVHRFGLSGYQKQQQRVFEQDRAIMLGARPPKKEHVNYKVYQQMLKDKKMKQKEEAKSESQKIRRKVGKTRSEKSKSSFVGELGGQVGRFKNGMLILSTRDIKKLKVKK